ESSGLAGPANINPTAGRPPVPGPSVGHDDFGEKHSCPKQPTLSEFPLKIIGKTKRSFSTTIPGWNIQYEWMPSSVFHAATSRLTAVWRIPLERCLSDWKKLSSKLEKHAHSQAHLNCMVKWDNYKSNYFNATSPDFQNEVIDICANLVRAEIVEKVQDTGFLSIIADEARSCKTEQLSVCLRYAEQLEIKERFLCFIDCSASRNALGLWKQ
ncbi:hypothetical protein F7725_026979, partial [Dissostichus mawsoni]